MTREAVDFVFRLCIGLVAFAVLLTPALAFPSASWELNDTITPTQWYDAGGVAERSLVISSAGTYKNSTDVPNANYSGNSFWTMGSSKGKNTGLKFGCSEDFTITTWVKVNKTDTTNNILYLGNVSTNGSAYEWFFFNNLAESSTQAYVMWKKSGTAGVSAAPISMQWNLLIYRYTQATTRREVFMLNATNRTPHVIINFTAAAGCPIGANYDTMMSHWNSGNSYKGKVYDWRTIRGTAINRDQMRTLLLGNFTAPVVPTGISFQKPDRADILNYSTRVVFTISGIETSYSNVNITINGVLAKTFGSVANDTQTAYWFNGTEGNNTIGVFANNTLNATKVFRLLYYNITDTDFAAAVNETALNQANITIANGSGIIVSKVELFHQFQTTINSSGGAYLGGNKWQNYYYSVVPATSPLSRDLRWNITLRLPTGATQVNHTNDSVAVYHAFNITGALVHRGKALGAAWEGENMRGSVYVAAPKQAVGSGTLTLTSLINGSTTFKTYMSYLSGANISIHPFYNAPAIDGRNATNLIHYNLNITDVYGNTRDDGAYRRTFRTFNLNISNCTFTDAKRSLVFRVKDEEDLVSLNNPDMAVSLDIWSNETIYSEFLFNRQRAGTNITFCNIPRNYSNGLNGNASLRYNATITIALSGYNPGLLTIQNGFENATNRAIYDVYLVNSTTSTWTDIKVYGNADDPAVGYLVQVQKYFASTNTYTTIFSDYTDDDGKVVAALIWYTTYYKYIISDPSGVVVAELAPRKISSTPEILRIGTAGTDWANIYGSIQHNCTYNNATKLLRCSITDVSGTTNTAYLRVYRDVILAYTPLCDTSGTGAAITLVCDLTAANTSQSFIYKLSIDMTGYSEYSLETGKIGGLFTLAYGNTGVLAGMLLTIGMAFGGFALGGLGGGVVLGAAGFILSNLISLSPLGEGTIIISVIVIAGIILIITRK